MKARSTLMTTTVLSKACEGIDIALQITGRCAKVTQQTPNVEKSKVWDRNSAASCEMVSCSRVNILML